MRLLVDAGNTRIKWALTRGDKWLEVGELSTAEAATLSRRLARGAEITEVWCSNVAGDMVAEGLSRGEWAARWHFVSAGVRQCGVHNGYESPERLGSDRWAALIAAWHLVGGSCLVVGCGTATTVDALSDRGEFLGGLILPGLDLMRSSLCGATARLRSETGHCVAFPRNTADAVWSGAVLATCGAIRSQHELLAAQVGSSALPVVLGGGAAEYLCGQLNLPLRLVDNPVLQGLWLIARETDA